MQQYRLKSALVARKFSYNPVLNFKSSHNRQMRYRYIDMTQTSVIVNTCQLQNNDLIDIF